MPPRLSSRSFPASLVLPGQDSWCLPGASQFVHRLSKWSFPAFLVPPCGTMPIGRSVKSYLVEWLFGASRLCKRLLVPAGCRRGLLVIPGCIPSSQNPALLGRLLESPGLARLLEASGLRPGRTQPCLGRLLESPGFALADYWNGYCQSAPNQMPTIISVISASIANFWIIWPWDFPLDSTPCLDFNQAKCFCFNWLLPNCPQPKA